MTFWKLALRGVKIDIKLSNTGESVVYTFTRDIRTYMKSMNVKTLKKGRFQAEAVIAESAFNALFNNYGCGISNTDDRKQIVKNIQLGPNVQLDSNIQLGPNLKGPGPNVQFNTLDLQLEPQSPLFNTNIFSNAKSGFNYNR